MSVYKALATVGAGLGSAYVGASFGSPGWYRTWVSFTQADLDALTLNTSQSGDILGAFLTGPGSLVGGIVLRDTGAGPEWALRSVTAGTTTTITTNSLQVDMVHTVDMNITGGGTTVWIDQTSYGLISAAAVGSVNYVLVGQFTPGEEGAYSIYGLHAGTGRGFANTFNNEFAAGDFTGWLDVVQASGSTIEIGDAVRSANSMQVEIGATTSEAYGQFTFAADSTQMSLRSVMYLPSATAATIIAANGRTDYIWAVTDNAGAVKFGAYLKESGGVLHWFIRDATGTEIDVGTSYTQTDTWHSIEAFLNNGGTSTVLFDSDSPNYVNLPDVGNMRKGYAGQFGGLGTVDNFDLYVGQPYFVSISPSVVQRIAQFCYPYLGEFDATSVGSGNALSVQVRLGVTNNIVSTGITVDCEPGIDGLGMTIAGLDPITTYHFESVLESDVTQVWGSLASLWWLWGGYGWPASPSCVTLPSTQVEVDDPTPGYWDRMKLYVYQGNTLDPINCAGAADVVILDGPTVYWNPVTVQYQLTSPPDVDTATATLISRLSAQLNAVAYPGGVNTVGYFEWGETLSYGNQTAPQALGAGTSAVPYDDVVSGLSQGTTYHFRAVTAAA